MRAPFRLTAAGSLQAVEVTPDHVVTASLAERTIQGVICEYGAIGYTTAGPTIFERGSLTVPDPLTKAKLLVQHEKGAAAVGVMASFTHDDKLPTAAFKLPAGKEGDQALTAAANGLRDGLSVGVEIDQHYYDSDNVLHVVASRVYEVSLVTVPAFKNAGVTSVAAAHQKGNTSMNREQLDAALAAGTITQEEYDRQVAALPAPAAPEAPAAPAAPAAPVAASQAEPQAAPPAAGIVTAAAARDVDLHVLAQRTVDHIKAHGPNGLTAALSDTVPGDDTGKAFLGNKKWLDQLWTVGTVRRPFIDTFGAGSLSTDGLEGYVWDPSKLPTVPQYAGDKGSVHSEELGWLPKTVSPVRFAGAWDIDRKFIDLGRTGMIAKAYEKATEDYKRKTEAYVRTTVLAGATNNATAVADVVTLLSYLGTLALGGDGTTSFSLDFVHLAPALYAEFINLSEDDVPWWMKAQGAIDLGKSSGNAGGIEFVSDPGLATRAWVAGDKNAVVYEELNPPIQVTAENIPNGGIDLGVFGYAACLVVDGRGIQKGTVTAPA